MKKIFLLSSLVLLGLVSCNGTSQDNCDEPEPCQICQDCEVCETSEEKKLKSAVNKLKSNLTLDLDVTYKREFESPIYASFHNSSNNLCITCEYKDSSDNNYVESKVSVNEFYGTVTTSIYEASGTYSKESQNLVDEYLTFDNKVAYKETIDYSTFTTNSSKDELLFNYLSELTYLDFTLDTEVTDKTVYTCDASFLNNFTEYILLNSFKGTVSFTLVDDSFTEFSLNLEPTKSIFVSSEYDGANVSLSLEGTGTLTYETSLTSLSPVSEAKISELDTMLAKFNDGFKVIPVNSTYTNEEALESALIQFIYDGDKLIADSIDFMSTYALGNLSWYDSVFKLNSETNKYYFDTYLMNEDDGTYYWTTTKEYIEEAVKDPTSIQEVDDSLFNFDEGDLKLSLANIDSSLFTKEEGSENTYVLNSVATKYFGETVVPLFYDYTATYMLFASLGLAYFEPLTSTATSWKVQIIDENTLRFFGEFETSLGDTSYTTSQSFIFTTLGDLDTSVFYESE